MSAAPEYVVASISGVVHLLRRAKPGIHALNFRSIAIFRDEFDASRAARTLNSEAESAASGASGDGQ